MSWLSSLFGKKQPDDFSRLNNTELLKAVHAIPLDEDALSELIEPDNLVLLQLHLLDATEEEIEACWAKKPRPGEILLGLLKHEPDPKKLLRLLRLLKSARDGFIPPADKAFPEGETGDVFCSPSEKGWTLLRIIKKEEVHLEIGKSYNISGERVEPPVKDFFLSIGVSLSDHYPSEAEALRAVETAAVSWKVLMAPMRPSGIRQPGSRMVGKLPPGHVEMQLYDQWLASFHAGASGSF